MKSIIVEREIKAHHLLWLGRANTSPWIIVSWIAFGSFLTIFHNKVSRVIENATCRMKFPDLTAKACP